MNNSSISHYQQDMRRGYLWGVPGVFVSGCVWLAAGLVAAFKAPTTAVYVLLIGGMFIFPASAVLCKALGISGTHERGNPLGTLAMEGTVWMLAGIVIAYAMHVLRPEWFFPAMLLVIGGRYLTFQTLYGLRIYWCIGAVLCAAGLVLGFWNAPAYLGALAGAAIELVFSVVIFVLAKRGETA